MAVRRRAEFFRQGAEARGLIRGQRRSVVCRWANLDGKERQTLRDLFGLGRGYRDHEYRGSCSLLVKSGKNMN